MEVGGGGGGDGVKQSCKRWRVTGGVAGITSGGGGEGLWSEINVERRC